MKKQIIVGALLAATAGVYLATRTASVVPGLALTISLTNSNQVIISWPNETNAVDQLQSADRIDAADGNWYNVAGATSSPVLLPMTKPFEFMKLVRNPPPAPTNVLVLISGDTPTVIKVSWVNQCVGCDSVNVFRSQDAQQWTQLAQLTATATNYTDSTAPSPGTNYFWIRSRKNKVLSN